MLRGFKEQILLPLLTGYIVLYLIFSPVAGFAVEIAEGQSLLLLKFVEKNFGKSQERPNFKKFDKYLSHTLSLTLHSPSSLREVDEGGPPLLPVKAENVFSWDKKLKKGKSYFRTLEIERVMSELQELVDAPYRYSLSGKGLDLVEEAILTASFLLFKTGGKEKSERLIWRYGLLSGIKAVPLELYPPDFVQYFEEAASKPYVSTIVVHTVPSKSRVVINKKFVGTTPLMREGNYFGRIDIDVEREGYIHRHFHRVAMPGDRINLDLTLDIDEVSEIIRGISAGKYEDAVESSITLLDRSKERGLLNVILKGDENKKSLDYILVVSSVEGNQPRYSIHRDLPLEGKYLDGSHIAPLLEDDLFISLLSSEGQKQIAALKEEKEHLTGKWWFWSILGIGAVGLVYTIVRNQNHGSSGTVNVTF